MRVTSFGFQNTTIIHHLFLCFYNFHGFSNSIEILIFDAQVIVLNVLLKAFELMLLVFK
jgi:hypothetical protein